MREEKKTYIAQRKLTVTTHERFRTHFGIFPREKLQIGHPKITYISYNAMQITPPRRKKKDLHNYLNEN